MQFDTLPEDVLIIIASNLCLHCQSPESFVNADVPEVLDDKRALSRLCRTSKALHAAAQPVLFHYFATGNLKKEIKLYRVTDKRIEAPWEYDFLPEFLHTIIQRPDLGSHIRSVQIVPNEEPERTSCLGYETSLVASLGLSAASHGLLPWRQGNSGQSERETLDHDDLVALLLHFAPKVHTLLFARSHMAEFGPAYRDTNISFPSLKTLGIISGDGDYHFSEMRYFFLAAPNIETLYACDAGGWAGSFDRINKSTDDMYLPRDMLGLQHLRKLRLEGLPPPPTCALTESLCEDLPETSPGLQDFEYYWNDREMVDFSLDELLLPLKPRLKRLCIAYLSRLFYPDAEYHKFFQPDVDYAPLTSLANFPRLEDVQIDARSLYRPTDPDSASRLITVLPKTVRKLRIMYVYRSIRIGLQQLALQAHNDLPWLKNVVVGVASGTNEHYADDIEKMREVEKVFEGTGMTFSWTVDMLSPNARTMVPGASAGSVLVPLPVCEERELK
jgi:hypothetical protein